jgi:excisionase family DNA binding protein
MVTLPDPQTQPTLTVPEAAQILGVIVRTVYNAVERNELPAIRVGRAIRIPTARFLAQYGFPTSQRLSPSDQQVTESPSAQITEEDLHDLWRLEAAVVCGALVNRLKEAELHELRD